MLAACAAMSGKILTSVRLAPNFASPAPEYTEVLMRRFLALLLLALPVAACGDKAGDDSTLKVGLIVSLTGNYAPLGTEDKKAVELAVQQIDNAGGLLGRKIELITKDDKSQP